MLASLFVSDLALIRRLSVDFHRGFSALTGETGAGKSLVLDALMLFCSAKGGKELIRQGAPFARVELFFDPPEKKQLDALSPYLSPEEAAEGITLSRQIYPTGRSVNKICDRSVPFSTLAALAKTLFCVHGQHEAGGLLDEKTHAAALDAAVEAEGSDAPSRFRLAWEDYRKEEAHLNELKSYGDDRSLLELYDFQLREIARLKPRAGEDEELETELERCRRAAASHGALYTAQRALSGGEKGKGAVFLLHAAARKLAALGEESSYASLSEELEQLSDRASEIERSLSFALSEIGEADPNERIDALSARIDALYRIKQKYAVASTDELIALYRQIKEKKDLTLSRKDDIKQSEERLDKKRAALLQASAALTAQRQARAARLEEEIHRLLAFLDMPKMRFYVTLEPLSFPDARGAESVRFDIAANTGEGKKRLSQVASGGELSRIMLALQLKLGHAKDAETLFFDEIDTGISGATAQKIGICLKTLAKEKQVFCVTHSAQVASLSENHWLVKKREENGRTETTLSLLDEKESLEEIARLLGGKELSRPSLEAAAALRAEGEREAKQVQQSILR